MTITSFSCDGLVEEEPLIFVNTTIGEDEDDKEIDADSVAQVMCQMHCKSSLSIAYHFLLFTFIRSSCVRN